MSNRRRYLGFSLIEVLLAVGTLAIGMIFVGGTFLVGLYLSGVSAEQTTAAIVANEAFSKIRIFGVNLAMCAVDRQEPFETVSGSVDPNEFAYPSTRTLGQKQYFWSALCRLDPNDPGSGVLVKVFVSRKVGSGTRYRGRDLASLPELIEVPYPRPVVVQIEHDPSGLGHGPYEVSIIDLDTDSDASGLVDEETFINDGYTIVENTTGQIYRMVNRVVQPDPLIPDTIILDRPWNPDGRYPNPDFVWVVPPAIGHGKGPCIEVYQGEVWF
ncbi:MAG: hypothetical protein JXN61_17190 [Sedimentisphaerales bacterium]|nr:hypothetical protein [Sedimentisphaerales bacterium]